MKQIIAFLFVLFSINTTFAQLNPVKWSASVEKISETEYNLIYSAEIEDHWHLYSQTLPEGGAIPTEFFYEEAAINTTFKLTDKAIESKSTTKYDKVFQMDLTYFDYEATFTQKIEVLNPETTSIKAEVSFQACDDKQCIFDNEMLTFQLSDTSKSNKAKQSNIFEPVKWTSKAKKISNTEYEITYIANLENKWHIYSQIQENDMGPFPTEFSFDTFSKDFELIGKTKESKPLRKHEAVFDMEVSYFENEATFTQRFKLLNPETKAIKAAVSFQVCDDSKCLAPDDFDFETLLSGELIEESQVANLTSGDIKRSGDLNLGVTGWEKYKKEEVGKKSKARIFFLGFLGGLIALLTPCVFPMIPLTVSFFTKSASNSQKGLANSMLYGFFIFLIYFLLSIPFHVLDSLDPEILNNISTNVTLNIIFFIIFIVFAFSFFGYFELTLPQSWSAALDSKANSIGGAIGIFFMALTLAIVSFSCTGPILGTLLGSSLSSDGGAMQLTAGMSGFGLALALPFTLFAMFPKWLNQLPKSGGWLNTVKVVLGFIEIALAFKFLSQADLVKHWGILPREIFIGIWIIVGICLLLYLIGKIRFPHDGPFSKISFSKGAFIFLVFAFVVYLIPGLTNTKYANLKLLSGIVPPLTQSLYAKQSECPLGLNCYKDIDEGVAAAKAENKPIMLDFTGWACANCRKMEEQVWSQDEIYQVLKDDYIIISLYVDDRKKLPKDEQFKYKKPSGKIKNIRTIGDKWATLQTLNFESNSQPFYVLLSHDMELLNHTNAYEPDEEVYLDWLQKGIENFKK